MSRSANRRATGAMFELVIFVGLQASGKSTFFRNSFAVTHTRVSKDLFRNNKNRNRRQAQLIEAALQEGKSVVVDNTNPTGKERRPLIKLGCRYGAKVVGYYFESEARRCLERNRQRTGKARVPAVALYATAKRLVLPSYLEGFDELFYVRITGNSSFEVLAHAREADAREKPGG
jgi:predicted kinase